MAYRRQVRASPCSCLAGVARWSGMRTAPVSPEGGGAGPLVRPGADLQVTACRQPFGVPCLALSGEGGAAARPVPQPVLGLFNLLSPIDLPSMAAVVKALVGPIPGSQRRGIQGGPPASVVSCRDGDRMGTLFVLRGGRASRFLVDPAGLVRLGFAQPTPAALAGGGDARTPKWETRSPRFRCWI